MPYTFTITNGNLHEINIFPKPFSRAIAGPRRTHARPDILRATF